MTLKPNREITNELSSAKKLIPDLDSKDLRSNKHKQSIQLTQTSILLKKLKILILEIWKSKTFSITDTTIGVETIVGRFYQGREMSGNPLVNKKTAGNLKTRKCSVQI